MISVRSHQPRLSGSSLFLLLCLLIFSQCRTTKTATKHPDQTNRPNSDSRPVPIDTITWKPTSEKPIEVEVDDIIEDNTTVEINSKMLGVILPLNISSITTINNQISSRHEAIIQYYIGMKLGLESLKQHDSELHVVFEDSQEDQKRVEQLLGEFQTRGIGYVFGGKGRKTVETIANFAKENNMFYASGWQVNSEFVGENERYIQFNPGFQAHIITILMHALYEYNPEQIILFGSKKEQRRIDEINRLYMQLTNNEDELETFIVEDMNELELLEMEEWKLVDKRGNPRLVDDKVFVVPVTRNVNLIHDFFRFLDFNEMHDRSVVYGVTDWNDEKLYNHLNNYEVRMTSFTNPVEQQGNSGFIESFFNKTGTFPHEKAFEGYNHILLMADLIHKMEDGSVNSNLLLNGHGVKAELVDHNDLQNPGVDKSYKPSYLENKSVVLLGYKDFQYYILPY